MKSYRQCEAILYGYSELKKQIGIEKIRLKELELDKSELLMINATDYSKTKVDGGTVESEVENKMIKDIEIDSNLKMTRNSILKKELKIEKIDLIIDSLLEKEKEIIRMKYFECIPNDVIYDTLGYSRASYYRHVKNLINYIRKFM